MDAWRTDGNSAFGNRCVAGTVCCDLEKSSYDMPGMYRNWVDGYRSGIAFIVDMYGHLRDRRMKVRARS